MASTLQLPQNPNYMNAGGSYGAWLTPSSQPTLYSDFFRQLASGNIDFATTLNTARKQGILTNVNGVCSGGCQGNAGISNWTLGLKNCAIFVVDSSALTDWNTNIAGKTLSLKISAVIEGVADRVPIYYFKKLMPEIPNGGSLTLRLESDTCVSDLWVGSECTSIPSVNQYTKLYTIFVDEVSLGGGTDLDCDDSRSSSSFSEFLITLSGLNVVDEQQSVSYNMLIQPDTNHTSGEITLSNTDNIYSSFKKYIGASVRMLDNVCCHGTGYVEILGDVHIEGFGYNEVSDIYLPVYRSLIRENVLFLRANFEDECCCYATSYSDEVSDLVNQYMSGYESYSAHSEIISVFTPKKIRWVGFERLENFCCDNSDCTEINPHDFDIEIPDSGGGGSDVDISCICDGLTSLTSMLSSKLDSLVQGQGAITEAIEGMEVSLDSECICDNLEGVVEKLDGIKESIDDKELSVTNSPQITVQPSSPIVTNPVNNITVEPSTPNITVAPCTPNITVAPCTPNINVQPCQPTVQNVINEGDVNIDNDDLIEKLDELFKSDDKTITDVIKDKEMGSNIDVEVSPADDVNVNRVYYTNQRNGDTSIND